MFGLSIQTLLIYIVAIVAGVALLLIFLRGSNVQIPPWLQQVLWIVVAAVVVILAIKFVFSVAF